LYCTCAWISRTSAAHSHICRYTQKIKRKSREGIVTRFRFLQRPLLPHLLVRLHLVADLEVLEVDAPDAAFGALLHLCDVLLAMLEGLELAWKGSVKVTLLGSRS